MKSLWDDLEAARFRGPLGERVYTSRLLGREPDLVLHGGGNTSVKLRERNIVGDEEDVLYVKGSGSDLVAIEAEGFAPVRLARLLALAGLSQLSDTAMVSELRAGLTRASAPTPSVEAILHAVLPYDYVDHTHAAALLSITNTADGESRIRKIYGDDVVIVPYVMPGFALARFVAENFPKSAHRGTQGMVLMNHGLFSFGQSARESYERMIALVTRAEEYLRRRGAWGLAAPSDSPSPPAPIEIALLRRDISKHAGRPMLVSVHDDSRSLAFVRRPNLAEVCQQGPITPDHVIRTKRVPMLGRDVTAYVQAYRRYFEEQAMHARAPVTMLDPAPRVVLDRAIGMLTVGRSARDSAIVRDLYTQTMDVIERAERLGGYLALPEKDIFDVEYWELEQAKLKAGAKSPVFAGEVALVTGAASGIGRACVNSLLARGAAVAALDIDPAVARLPARPDLRGIVCDVTNPGQVSRALDETVRAFGGLDMLVLNAGVFPAGKRIAELDDAEWQRVLSVNLDANLSLLREAHALLRLAPHGGRVVVIGSKNVPAPGPGAAAYSASKAALNQLARVAALEWGADGIRINSLHPNAVFDTGIWTDEVLAARAAHYGLSVEAYKRRNVLGVEVSSRDVAELAAELCGPLFAKTTGAQIPIDGGNERVI